MWLNLHEGILEEFVEAERLLGERREWLEAVAIIERKDALRGPVKTNAQRLREYRKRNPAKVNARNRAAYAKNREKHKARVKAWKAANRERVYEAARRRRAARKADGR